MQQESAFGSGFATVHQIGFAAFAVAQERRTEPAQVVAATGLLYLDHLCSQIAEQLRTPGAGEDAAHVQHANSAQGTLVHARLFSNMPTNLFQEETDVQPEPEWDGFYLRRSGGSPEDIQRTLDMLLQAKRPVIFIGHGVTLSEASKELTEFAHALQIPVISSPNGMGCLDMTDIRPPGTGAWALPPIPHKEPVFGAKYIPGK